ncbi:hypothetical protein JOD15_000016 [Enterococcus ureilyticus]|nr:hypothetical protein [Enterococcus ureilyticus]
MLQQTKEQQITTVPSSIWRKLLIIFKLKQ